MTTTMKRIGDAWRGWLHGMVGLREQPDNPEKDYADLFPMNDQQLVDEFDRLTDFSNPTREPNVKRMERCISMLASHHIANIKREREKAKQPNG